MGSVTDYLRKVIEDRFAVKDLSDGFFYWPVQMAGVELRNPLIPLFPMCDSLRKAPIKMLEEALDLDELAYNDAKVNLEKENTGSGLGRYKNNPDLSRNTEESDEEYTSVAEFLQYREERSNHLFNVCEELLSIPEEKAIDQTPQISSWLESLPTLHSRSKRCKSNASKVRTKCHTR